MEEGTSEEKPAQQSNAALATDSKPASAISSASSSVSTGKTGMAANTLPPDALDYFSETAAKLGTGGSTGVMIQSPDGRPAGIFFHPRTNSSSTVSSVASGGGGGGSAVRTPGISSTMMGRRGSGDERNTTTTTTLSTTSSLTPSSQPVGGVHSDDPSHTAQSNGNAKTAMPSLTATSGNLFAPTVGLQSIFSRQRPPTATLLRQTIDPHTNNDGSVHKISLDAYRDNSRAETATVKGDKADMEDAEPRSPLEGTDGAATLPLGSISPPSTSAQDETGLANKRQSLPASVGRQSFGTDGLSARQTFSSTLGASAAARPSAQPQSGLLIGAGFSQPRRKGGMGPKRSAQNIEVLPPIKVLIVEDNPINVKILSTFLRHRKIKFGVARDGREAVQEWEAGGYHLILMDIQLPIMDGIEATKEIRRLEQMANIGPMSATTPGILPSADRSAKELGGVGDMASKPTDGGTTSPYAMLQNSLRASVIIVALTASVLNSDRVAALAAGCNDFLNKPVDLRWLERKVIEWGSMQYLISFREWPNADGRTTSRSKGAAGVRKTYLAPTQSENARSDGQVDRAFNVGPDKLARELAGRLYIGGKKPKTESTAPTSAGQDASPVPAGQ